MITCNQCGKLVPTGAIKCQYCGAFLTGTTPAGGDVMPTREGNPGMTAPEQPALPAWLETLRAGERPAQAPPASGKGNFQAADTADRGALPVWMRSSGEAPDTNNFATSRFAATSMPPLNAGYLPPQGLSASSLIDEQSLPTWLRGNQMPQQAPANDNLAGSSLIQQDALPEWMKNLQQPLAAPSMPTPSSPPASFPMQRTAASELIDQESLPSWMVKQEGAVEESRAQGLAASSLIDMNALPAWLRGEGNAPQQASSGSLGSQSAAPGQVSEPAGPSRNTNLSAASFLDMNALPEWLRPAGEQPAVGAAFPQQQSSAQNFKPASAHGPFTGPTENARVPSRPRGEITTNEESQVAATVFASLLGVASVAPHFPSQPVPPAAPSHAGMAGSAQQMTPDMGQGSGMEQGSGMLPQSATGNAPASAGVGPGGYPPVNMGAAPAQPQWTPPNGSAAPRGPASIGASNQMNGKETNKPARRGIFDTLRDFFFRN